MRTRRGDGDPARFPLASRPSRASRKCVGAILEVAAFGVCANGVPIRRGGRGRIRCHSLGWATRVACPPGIVRSGLRGVVPSTSVGPSVWTAAGSIFRDPDADRVPRGAWRGCSLSRRWAPWRFEETGYRRGLGTSSRGWSKTSGLAEGEVAWRGRRPSRNGLPTFGGGGTPGSETERACFRVSRRARLATGRRFSPSSEAPRGGCRIVQLDRKTGRASEPSVVPAAVFSWRIGVMAMHSSSCRMTRFDLGFRLVRAGRASMTWMWCRSRGNASHYVV